MLGIQYLKAAIALQDVTWHGMAWHDTWHDMTWHDMKWLDMTWQNYMLWESSGFIIQYSKAVQYWHLLTWKHGRAWHDVTYHVRMLCYLMIQALFYNVCKQDIITDTFTLLLTDLHAWYDMTCHMIWHATWHEMILTWYDTKYHIMWHKMSHYIECFRSSTITHIYWHGTVWYDMRWNDMTYLDKKIIVVTFNIMAWHEIMRSHVMI